MATCKTPAEICELYSVLGCCPVPTDNEYKTWQLQMLCQLRTLLTPVAPVAPGVSVLSTGNTSPVPAGVYTVTIVSLTGTVIVNGISIPNTGSSTLTANNNKVLPAIPITGGGTFVWGAIT